MQDELTQAHSHMEVVARLFEKLYEDNVSGKVSDEWFMQLSGKYEAERNTLKQRIAELQLKLKDAENKKSTAVLPRRRAKTVRDGDSDTWYSQRAHRTHRGV